MNRRLNTVLFLVGATLANIVMMFAYFIVFLALAGLILPVRGDIVGQIVWILLFAGAVVAGFFTYRLLFAVFRKKIPLERYFDQALFKDK